MVTLHKFYLAGMMCAPLSRESPSGKVEKIDDKATGLLSAAEKYDLKV